MQGELSPLWTYGFYVLIVWGLSAVLVAFRLLAPTEGWAAGLRLGAFAWLGLPAILAITGILSNFDARPPNLMRLLAVLVVLQVAFVLSPWGRRAAEGLPFTLLIGTQLFRLPLEVLLFGLSTSALLPREMTFAGYNYDIITGATAGLFWFLLRRYEMPSWSLWAWNVLGLLTLLTVVTVAVLAFPQPFGWFSPPTEIVAHYPWVWLPTFLVPVAFLSHLLVLRKLLLAPVE